MDLATRHRYMKAMGIPLWIPRAASEKIEEDGVQDHVEVQVSPNPGLVNAHPQSAPAYTQLQETPPRSQPSPATSLAQTLEAVPNTRPIVDEVPVAQLPSKPNQEKVTAAPDCTAMDWQTLQTTVSACQLCDLHKSRTQTVFGTGNRQADWMIIGEAPGANEDRQGEPFVGRAGQLLNNMLAALGLPREAVYIGNILKCRPPNNRDPKPEESALCRGYLERQIALVNPALIMVVGRIAAHNLLQVNTPLGRLRGKVHELPGTDIPVIVGYHPAYLLRQPAEKRKAWQDLKLAREVMNRRLAQ